MSDERERPATLAIAHGDQVLAYMRDSSPFSAVFPQVCADLLVEFALVGVSFVTEIGNEIDDEPVARRVVYALLDKYGTSQCSDRCCAMLALSDMYGRIP
ncbi:MAG: hypothetical protein RLZZ21_1367 [Planctomycetota bacterium]|jgi:hypothetical protein